MNLRKAGLFLVPVSLALCAGSGVARYSVDAALVLVPVTVTDRDGRSPTNLQREHFQVLEDASPRQILSFAQEDAPASIGLIVDVSGSMKGKLAQALAAARNITDSCEERDETFLITFADQPRLLSVSRGYPSDALRPLQYSAAAGSTSLIDAVVLGLHQSRKAAHRRRALVVISDGMDNQSRYTAPELLSQARENDAVIYTISLRES